MGKHDIALITNMTTPYRAPFFEALAANKQVKRLRVYTCVAREHDRKWDVKAAQGYSVINLWGFTLNLSAGKDATRILHIRLGIFWQLLRHRPSTVVIGDASWTSFISVLVCMLYGLKYVVWNEITTSSGIGSGLVHSLRLWMYRHAKHVVASCTLAKNYLLNNNVPEHKISIVNNAVDNGFFLSQKKAKQHLRNEFRAALGIEADAYCYIFVGQLISRKKVLEAVEYVVQQSKSKHCHLLVVGTGPLENEMKSKAAHLNFDAITFCGYANQNRLSELYIASDCLVLLSEDEPWGMVVNEALLFNLELFLSESVGARDLQAGGLKLIPTPESMALLFVATL